MALAICWLMNSLPSSFKTIFIKQYDQKMWDYSHKYCMTEVWKNRNTSVPKAMC